MMTPRHQTAARYGLQASASIALVVGWLGSAGCPSRTALGPAAQDAMRERYRGETFYLKQSLYYGPFYSDKKRTLIDARPFEQLRFMTAPDGDIIIPASPQGILPAGTKVKVVDISFPTSVNIARRPLFTPRYNIWVIMRVGRYGGDVDLYRPGDHIWVLGSTVREEEAIEAHLGALLSRDDLTPWLAQRSESARLAINEKRAEEGLLLEELIAALGFPDRTDRRFEGETRIDEVHYGDDVIVLENDVVKEIRGGAPRPSSAPAEEDAASTTTAHAPAAEES